MGSSKCKRENTGRAVINPKTVRENVPTDRHLSSLNIEYRGNDRHDVKSQREAGMDEHNAYIVLIAKNVNPIRGRRMNRNLSRWLFQR